MMKNTLKKQKLFFISLIGLVVVSLVMGTTYAYQTLIMNETEEREVSIKSGVLDIKFERTNLINNTNMPLLPSYNYADYTEFTIDNTNSTEDVVFKISLSGIEYGYIDNSGTKVSGCRTATTSLQAACIIDENFKYTLVEIIDGNETLVIEGNFGELATTEVELSNYINIAKGETKIYRLYLWLNETQDNQNHLENTYFKGRLNITSKYLKDAEVIEPEPEDYLLVDMIIESAKSAKNESDSTRTIFYDINETLPSTPAKQISGADEKVLAMTEDDYTNKILDNGEIGDYSYYFRGNVEDNYVNFADMCWRIVRIAGDGSVKLVLEDQDDECKESDGNWNIGIVNYGYSSTSGPIINRIYKMNYLMPTTSNSLSMVKGFYDFQTNKLADYSSNLKSGNWCLGDNAYVRTGTDGNYTYTLLQDTSNNYSSKEEFYYDAYKRLVNVNQDQYHPTLTCNGRILDEFADVSGVSGIAPMYVSALTADEVVFAGGKYYTSNVNYYLINQYQVSKYVYFWSFSPAYFDGKSDIAIGVTMNGQLGTADVSDGEGTSFRPSISLAPNVKALSGGIGTKDKPYVIK